MAIYIVGALSASPLEIPPLTLSLVPSAQAQPIDAH